MLGALKKVTSWRAQDKMEAKAANPAAYRCLNLPDERVEQAKKVQAAIEYNERLNRFQRIYEQQKAAFETAKQPGDPQITTTTNTGTAGLPPWWITATGGNTFPTNPQMPYGQMTTGGWVWPTNGMGTGSSGPYVPGKVKEALRRALEQQAAAAEDIERIDAEIVGAQPAPDPMDAARKVLGI